MKKEISPKDIYFLCKQKLLRPRTACTFLFVPIMKYATICLCHLLQYIRIGEPARKPGKTKNDENEQKWYFFNLKLQNMTNVIIVKNTFKFYCECTMESVIVYITIKLHRVHFRERRLSHWLVPNKVSHYTVSTICHPKWTI